LYARCIYLKDNKCYIYFAVYWMKRANAKFQNNDSAILMRRAEHSVLNKLVFTAHKYMPLSHQLPKFYSNTKFGSPHDRCLLRQHFLHGMPPHNCNVQNWNVLFFILQWFTQFDDSSEISIILVLSTGIFKMSYEFPGWNSKLQCCIYWKYGCDLWQLALQPVSTNK